MFGKRNGFIFDVRRKEKRKVHHPISLKGNKENKEDFTRTTRKDKIHFPCVKMRKRKRATEKEGRIKRMENGESNQHL